VEKSPTSSAASATQATDAQFLATLFERIASDLAMIIDREFTVKNVHGERMRKRAEGKGKTHVSFKLAFKRGESTGHGCVLIPLPDAITVAAYLMMVQDDGVKSHRMLSSLDMLTKDAMLEVGNFIGGAFDAIVRAQGENGASAKSEGCQGVRANVRPALEYKEGEELVIGHAQAQIHSFPAFEMIAIVPPMAMS
jgi:hypothetical protein